MLRDLDRHAERVVVEHAGPDGDGDGTPDASKLSIRDFSGTLKYQYGSGGLHPQERSPDKILALEMGGNNPIIAWDADDIHSAAVLVIQSAFLSAGQRCTAARRLIVEDRLYDPLIEQVNALAGRLIVGAMGNRGAPSGPIHDAFARKLLARLFPQTKGRDVRFEHAWHGRIGMTSDHIPKVLAFGPDAYAVFGYSGRGIAPGTVFGTAAARALLAAPPQLPPTPGSF